VRVYVGQTRSRRLIAELSALGIGECTSRGEHPPRRIPWFADNGAFGDWKAGRSFDIAAFESDLPRIREAGAPPDFIVCPDIVAGGLDSLAFSLAWLPRLRFACPGLPVYLAVQDGMEEGDVPDGFHGIFVGGSLPWKLATGARWVREAHRRGLPCHVGRVGNARRVAWAIRIGADSIDSSLPLWSQQKMRSFLAALDGRQQEIGL
jgi:hypothetical protein